MTDAAPEAATPIFSLPPVPLTDEFLLELAAEDDVEQLWVPTARPAAVTTRAGVHEGTILTFWIERAEDYTLLEYRTGEAGLRWYRSKRTRKDEDIGSILAEHLGGKPWTPLAVHSRGFEPVEQPVDGLDDIADPFAALVDVHDACVREPFALDQREEVVVEGAELSVVVGSDGQLCSVGIAEAVLAAGRVHGPAALLEAVGDGQALGEVLFGEIRQYRGGGEVHMDLMFDGLQAELPDRNDPIIMGVTAGYDFFGGHAVYVEGFARDTACANSIRALTEREAIRHVGDVEDLRDWWEARLKQLDLLADDLLDCIAAAQDVTLNVGELPFDLEAFYELLGFPAYLAEHAAGDARANAADLREPDLWVLHSGATYALTHQFRGGDGSALQEYTRLANDCYSTPRQPSTASRRPTSASWRPTATVRASSPWRAQPVASNSSRYVRTSRRRPSSSNSARNACASDSGAAIDSHECKGDAYEFSRGY